MNISEKKINNQEKIPVIKDETTQYFSQQIALVIGNLL